MNWRSWWVPALMLLALLVLHFPGWFQGQVYGDEDLFAIFWTDKIRLYRLAQGLEPWSWWDPLWCLGCPRLANFQVGWFSPDNLFFLLLPPQWAWRFYPLLSDIVLYGSVLWLIRTYEPSQWAAWGAGLFLFTYEPFFSTQNPTSKASLIYFCWQLGFLGRYFACPRPRWLLGLGLSSFWHVVAGAATDLFTQSFSLLLILAWQYWASPCWKKVHPLLAALLAIGGGVLLSACAVLPLLDFASHSSRQLIPPGSLAGAYCYTPWELAWRYCSEGFALAEVRNHRSPEGYPLVPLFSLLTWLGVLAASRRPRFAGLVALGLILAAQTMGERGGLLWLLHQLVPSTQMLRGANRFILPAALVWVLVWSVGQAYLAQRRSRAAWGVALWTWSVALIGLGPKVGQRYLDPSYLAPIPLPSGSGRVAIDFWHQPPPLHWLSNPLAQGRASLTVPLVLCDQSYLLGLLFSQFQERWQERLPGLAMTFVPAGVAFPDFPLLQSWGLEWLGQLQQGQFRWLPCTGRLPLGPPASRRAWIVNRVTPCLDRQQEWAWATRRDWKPFQEASSQEVPPFALGPDRADVEVLQDHPDRQVLRTRGGAGLLLLQDNWDPGWRCRLDGQEIGTLRGNLALKACWVPAGEHRVEWSFEPRWLTQLGWAWALGLCCWAVSGLLARAQSKQGGPSS